MPESEVIEEMTDVEEVPYIEGMCTLQVHRVQRLITKPGFCCLQFFKIATDAQSFYTYCYRSPGDSHDPCGHLDIPVGYNMNKHCGSCLEGETGQD